MNSKLINEDVTIDNLISQNQFLFGIVVAFLKLYGTEITFEKKHLDAYISENIIVQGTTDKIILSTYTKEECH